MAVIEVKHFKKSFGNRTVHADVNFKVEKGECVGLVGGSGVGKSVVLRSLIGLEKPDSGEMGNRQYTKRNRACQFTQNCGFYGGGAPHMRGSNHNQFWIPL